MNEIQWEYLLLHSLPKEWVLMTDETGTTDQKETEETQANPEDASKNKEDGNDSNGQINEKTEMEGKNLNGTATGHQTTDSQPNTDGNQTDTHSTGQGTEAISGGRVSSGGSGNTPGEPASLSTGDFGKDRNGNWRTRKTERKSFGFQRRKREREAAQGQKG